MGQPESQRSGKGGRGRTGGREEWEEEQKSKYWHGSAGELPGTWLVPFPICLSIQPFPLTPFPSHLSFAQLPAWMHTSLAAFTRCWCSQEHPGHRWPQAPSFHYHELGWTGRAAPGSWAYLCCSSALSCP